MPLIATKYFGPLPADPQSTLTFPEGLPGFDSLRTFVLIAQPLTAPLVFLQSDQDAEVCFPLLPMQTIDPAYTLPTDSAATATPGNSLFAIVAFTESGDCTANLRAPISIDAERLAGCQIVRADETYATRHPVAALPHTPQEEPC